MVWNSSAFKIIRQYACVTAIGIYKSDVGVTLMFIAKQVAKTAGEGTVV